MLLLERADFGFDLFGRTHSLDLAPLKGFDLSGQPSLLRNQLVTLKPRSGEGFVCVCYCTASILEDSAQGPSVGEDLVDASDHISSFSAHRFPQSNFVKSPLLGVIGEPGTAEPCWPCEPVA